MNRNYRMSGYYISRNTTLAEVEQAEAEDAIFAQESENAYSQEMWNKQFRLSWESNGHSISIELRAHNVMEYDFYFRIEIDGAKRQYRFEDIKPYSNSTHPEIVARIGQAGLSSERRNALTAMWKQRSEWFLPIC
jgi:hypothetical protein